MTDVTNRVEALKKNIDEVNKLQKRGVKILVKNETVEIDNIDGEEKDKALALIQETVRDIKTIALVVLSPVYCLTDLEAKKKTDEMFSFVTEITPSLFKIATKMGFDPMFDFLSAKRSVFEAIYMLQNVKWKGGTWSYGDLRLSELGWIRGDRRVYSNMLDAVSMILTPEFEPSNVPS